MAPPSLTQFGPRARRDVRRHKQELSKRPPRHRPSLRRDGGCLWRRRANDEDYADTMSAWRQGRRHPSGAPIAAR